MQWEAKRGREIFFQLQARHLADINFAPHDTWRRLATFATVLAANFGHIWAPEQSEIQTTRRTNPAHLLGATKCAPVHSLGCCC